ncbi:DUF1613-domain-containing protein [Lactarius indigo]|nr:DUF1613-domain-containing protein [Lactarius indigo]
MTRPRFNPSPCKGLDATTLQLDKTSLSWSPIISCLADFPPELFELAVSQLIHHPEYNSTLILRSEVIEESTEQFPVSVPLLRDLQPVRNIHRRLLARRPTRDSGLEQHCTLYVPSHPSDSEAFHPTVLVLTPILPSDGSLPYYHPTVTHLAFRIILPTPSESAVLRIEALPLPGTPLDPGARLYRTCLSLLETLHRYGWGTLTHYKKRVLHDVVLPRETYQDLYLIMRERYKHLIDDWHEVTDPLKHVFEDIGIATFLVLLWKDTYGPETVPLPADSSDGTGLSNEPWRRWPRPPGGFVDLGCGNGLLTHILVSEGYAGHGFDLRSRTSWTHYPPATQSCLFVRALDPTTEKAHHNPSPAEQSKDGQATTSMLLPADCFLIGNHSDELTPWVPLLATRVRASGYLSIPCCAWGLDARFDRARDVPHCNVDAETLNLGGGGEGAWSSYALYRVWLASLSVYCGWAVEVEVLRIPSTRNWAIVGRKRVGSLEEADNNVEELIEGVSKRGQFKTRRPEGKAGGDH